MHVLSKCIRDKHKVKYISTVKTLDWMFYNLNNELITTTLARELIQTYAGDAHDSEYDAEDIPYQQT